MSSPQSKGQKEETPSTADHSPVAWNGNDPAAPTAGVLTAAACDALHDFVRALARASAQRDWTAAIKDLQQKDHVDDEQDDASAR